MNPEELQPVTAIVNAHPDLASVSPRTVARWLLRGCRGVKLESRIVGGRRMTSRAAMDRFLAALNAPATGAPEVRSPSERNRASEDAAAELAKVGA